MKQVEEQFYDMGFSDAKNSSDPAIFQARRMGFMQGWIVAVEALNLLETSPFRDPTQLPLPNDLSAQAQIGRRPVAGSEKGEEEGEDSPSMRELTKQIDSHVVAVYLDNLASPVAPKDTGTLEVALASTAPSSSGASLVLPDVAQNTPP